MNTQRIDFIKDYITTRLSIWETYHNHKENMANAGFLVQLSLFGSITTETIWPPKWVNNVLSKLEHADLYADIGTFLVYFILWFLIHYYIRWQLINKRVAALYFAGFETAFRKLALNKLSSTDLQPVYEEIHSNKQWKDYLSKLIYIPHAYTKMDANINGLPKFLADSIKECFAKGTGASTLEILMTYTSILLLFIVAIKIFLS